MKKLNKLLKALNEIAEEELGEKRPTLICESGRHTATPSKNVQIKAGDSCYSQCGKWKLNK